MFWSFLHLFGTVSQFQSIASLAFVLNVFVPSSFFVFFSPSLVGDPFIERSAWNSLLHWGSELNDVWTKRKRVRTNRTEQENEWMTNEPKVLNKSRDTRLPKKINERTNERTNGPASTAYFVSPRGTCDIIELSKSNATSIRMRIKNNVPEYEVRANRQFYKSRWQAEKRLFIEWNECSKQQSSTRRSPQTARTTLSLRLQLLKLPLTIVSSEQKHA